MRSSQMRTTSFPYIFVFSTIIISWFQVKAQQQYAINRTGNIKSALFRKITDGSILVVDKTASFSNVMLYECARGCIRNTACLSFNYYRTAKSCDLLKYNRTTASTVVFNVTKDASYYDTGFDWMGAYLSGLKNNFSCPKNLCTSGRCILPPGEANHVCVPWICVEKNTSWYSSSNTTSHHLLKYQLACDNGYAINGFVLQYDGGSSYRYTYKCCKLIFHGSNAHKMNDWTIHGDGHTIYLDRQRIRCNGSFLSSLQLKKDASKYRYIYDYIESSITKSKFDTSTSKTQEARGSFHPLIHLSISCPEHYFVSGVHLKRDKGSGRVGFGKVRYDFNCSKTLYP